MTLVLGIMGKKLSGKSTVAASLQAHYNMSSPFHLEMSEPIIEAANAWTARWHLPDDVINYDDERLADYYNQVLAWDLVAAVEQHLNIVVKSSAESRRLLLISEGQISENLQLFNYLRNFATNSPAAVELISDDIDKDKHRALLQWLGGFLRARYEDSIWVNEIGRLIDLFYRQSKVLMTIGGIRFSNEAEMIRLFQGLLLLVVRPDQAENELDFDVTEQSSGNIVPDIVLINDSTRINLSRAARLLVEGVI